jgi:hypothetical protein
MSVPISSWNNDLMSKLRGADIPMVEAEVRKAVIWFCEISRKYHDQLTAIDLVGGTATYTPTAPDLVESGDQVVCGIHTVRLVDEDMPLDQKSESDLDMVAMGWRTGTFSNGTPTYYLLKSSRIQLIPAPTADVTGGLIVDAILAPSNDAANVADELFKRQSYRETIEAKVLSEMYMMHTKPWQNMAAAPAYRQRALDGIGVADLDNMRGHARPAHRTRLSYR